MYMYRFNFTGYEDQFTYILTHKKHFSEKEIYNLVCALEYTHSRRLAMNDQFRLVGCYELSQCILNDLYHLGFKPYVMPTASKFLDSSTGEKDFKNILYDNADKDDDNIEQYEKLLKIYFREEFDYYDEE